MVFILIGQIQVDYKGLVKEKVTGKMGQVASLLVGEKLEKLALELLWTEESRQKLIELAQDALAGYLKDRVSGIAADKNTKGVFICGY